MLQVIVNNLNCKMVLAPCQLTGAFPLSTVYSRVSVARKRGAYDVLKLREEEEIRRLVIDVAGSEIPLSDGNDATS
jgi:hypothetical protein